MAGLRKEDTEGEYINLNKSYVLKEEKTSMKTAFRKRQIFITKAIRERLDILTNRTSSPYLVTTPRGTRLNSTDFAKVWKKGVDQAGLPPMTSYSARHSFAAWSLTIGINPLRLFGLMGHASKQMVFEVYGNYVEGLEEDAESICEYFGQDFLTPRKKKNPVQFRHSTGHSQQVSVVNN